MEITHEKPDETAPPWEMKSQREMKEMYKTWIKVELEAELVLK